MEQAEIWAGLRPCTPDGLPVVDRVPGTENLWLATGHAMLGISLAAVTGELVAALISVLSRPSIRRRCGPTGGADGGRI